MTMTELNGVLKPAPSEILLKPGTVVHVHDTKSHVTYKLSIRDLAKAVSKQMALDGDIPQGGD